MNRLILKVLFGKQKESYEGEYVSEALEIIDEYVDDENPDFLTNKLKEYQKQDIYESLVIVEIEIDEEKIKSFLRPVNKIKGIIKDV